ncbi:MAG: hypothetical protein RLZZ592_30 [Pseudomonadota bacterium]|jgi:hypothetical protein|nr:hypothetical protein [Pseudomonadota bacterium]MDQ5896075.1 hypothetical protein [Pseudomonadota bacterium]
MIWPAMTAPDYSGLDDQALRQVRPALKLEAEALIAEVIRRAQQQGLQDQLDPAPQSPVHCCGRGCSNCVWIYFYSEVMFWRDAALARHTTAEGASCTACPACCDLDRKTP